jgi:hypothetical protein
MCHVNRLGHEENPQLFAIVVRGAAAPTGKSLQIVRALMGDYIGPLIAWIAWDDF